MQVQKARLAEAFGPWSLRHKACRRRAVSLTQKRAGFPFSGWGSRVLTRKKKGQIDGWHDSKAVELSLQQGVHCATARGGVKYLSAVIQPPSKQRGLRLDILDKKARPGGIGEQQRRFYLKGDWIIVWMKLMSKMLTASPDGAMATAAPRKATHAAASARRSGSRHTGRSSPLPPSAPATTRFACTWRGGIGRRSQSSGGACRLVASG